MIPIAPTIVVRQGSDRAFEVESCFGQAMAMALEQGALLWELRIALSRCRLRVTQGRGDDGRRELASVYDRFTEGFDTTDLMTAKTLLDTLDTPGSR